MANDWFPNNVPRTPGELEQFFLEVIKKLGNTSSSLDDLDQRSFIPALGMIQALDRKLESIIREQRAIRIDLDAYKRVKSENRLLRSNIHRLEKRIEEIEKEIT